MKKLFVGLGILTSAVLGGVALSMKAPAIQVKAEEVGEGEIISEPETYESKVIIVENEHGKITADVVEGHVGDIVTLTVEPSLCYVVESVSVNEISLVPAEGKYTFALAEGENTVTSKFKVDEEMLGVFSDMFEEASNKDWTNLFSMENVVTLVKWVLDGGVLIMMARYFIKDKKLEKKVEESVSTTISNIIPDTTKQTVIASVQEVVAPMMSQVAANQDELVKAMDVFAKCMALSQENTPESRKAILDELSGLKIGDLKSIEEAKQCIMEMVAKAQKTYEETLAAINNISKKNQDILEDKQPVEETTPVDTGIQI